VGLIVQPTVAITSIIITQKMGWNQFVALENFCVVCLGGWTTLFAW
jgi:hypothetical protein